MSVDEIRTQLVKLGLSQDEANNIKGKASLMAKLEELQEVPFEVEQEENESVDVPEPVKEICPTDPEWKDFVMSKFDPKDEVFNGCPTVDGLRRITELVIGPIIESNAKVVQSPNKDNNYHAVVEHEIVVLRKHFLDFGELPYKQVVTEVADVKTDEKENTFTKYAAAYASTRAEGRALRKLLRLRKIVAVEEMDSFQDTFNETYNSDATITATQCMTINLIAKRNDVNTWDMIKDTLSSQKIKHPREISYNDAKDIIGYLNEVDRGKEELPPEFKGYKPLHFD